MLRSLRPAGGAFTGALVLCGCLGPVSFPSHAGSPAPTDAGSPASSDVGSPAPADAGDQDAALPDHPEAGQPSFTCAGKPQLQLDDGPVWTVPVTTVRPIMNCCDAVVVRFHPPDVQKPPVAISFIDYGAQPWPTGTVELGSLPEGLKAAVSMDGRFAQADDVQLSGTATFDASAPDRRLRVSICATITLLGNPAGTVRAFVDLPTSEGWGGGERFGLYLLGDQDSADQAKGKPLDSLALQDNPLFGLDELSWYDARDTTFHLSAWAGDVKAKLPPVGFYGLPFVVVADSSRLYLGAFWTELSSAMFEGPVIDVEQIHDGVLPLVQGYPGPQDGPDVRNHPSMLRVLSSDFRRSLSPLAPEPVPTPG